MRYSLESRAVPLGYFHLGLGQESPSLWTGEKSFKVMPLVYKIQRGKLSERPSRRKLGPGLTPKLWQTCYLSSLWSGNIGLSHHTVLNSSGYFLCTRELWGSCWNWRFGFSRSGTEQQHFIPIKSLGEKNITAPKMAFRRAETELVILSIGSTADHSRELGEGGI